MSGKHFVYIVIQEGSHFVKIGVASNPRLRLVQLQGGNPSPLTVAATFPFQKRDFAEQVEFRTHRILTPSRCCGEWFSCGIDEAMASVSAAITYVKNRRGNMTYDRTALRSRNLGVSA